MGKNKYGVIYMIYNKVSDKRYIGLTTSKRGFDGRYSAEGKGIERVYNFYKYQENNNQFTNIHLLNSIEKYGFDNFEIYHEIDNASSKKELRRKEMYWIDKFDTTNIDKGYNKTKGGDSFLSGKEHPRYNSVTFKCKMCGELTTRWKSMYTRSQNNYCSQSCRHKDKSIVLRGVDKPNYNSKTVNCNYCNNQITKPKSLINDKNYCSMDCKNKHQTEILKGENNPNYGNKGKVAGSKNGRARKVLCITTGEIFDCLKDGADKYNTRNSCISSCCTGRQKTAGKLKDGTKLKWKYLNESLIP